jgi:hypothetical protein
MLQCGSLLVRCRQLTLLRSEIRLESFLKPMADLQSTDVSKSDRFPTFTRFGPLGGRWILRFLILAFGVFIVYALSIGPALQLNKRGMISAETIERFYFPLSFVPVAQPILDWYIRLWVPGQP